MTSRCLIIITTILCFCLSNLVVECTKDISKDVVKTIQTEDGEYDCVDFYKQPAFDHPSLKNHSFHPEMRPSFIPKWSKDDRFANQVDIDIKLKGDTCPRGTVPIRRFNDQDDDHISQTQSRRQSYATLGQTHSNSWSPSNIYFALGQSRSDLTKVYNGIAANLSVFNPHVEKYQYSSAEIIIKGGSDAIITGWTVNPMVYRDNKTRFFIYTVTTDNHCMNAKCGFIQVRSDLPLDFRIEPISSIEGPMYVFHFFIYKDPKNGNWWLQVGPDDMILGFWPQNFFRGLYYSGNYIACGGEVYGPLEMGNPNMGTGYKPNSEDPKWSFCQNVKVVDEAHNVVLKTDLIPYSNNGHNYDVDVYDAGDEHYVFYGGPQKY